MWWDMVKYVTECLPYQQNKVDSKLTAGLVSHYPFQEGKWMHIAMDFTTRLLDEGTTFMLWWIE